MKLLNSQNIQLAKFAGFCYGVKRAVDTAKKIKAENPNKNIYVLGELIHNMDVIKELDDLGIKTIYEIPEKGEGICIVRSHGEAPEVFEKLEKAGFEVIDMTCLDVKKVQQRAIELAQNDYFVVIVGKSNHPEVIAIKANAEQYSDKVIVGTTIEEIQSYEKAIREHNKVGVVVQTTQMLSTLNTIVSYLNSISKEVLVHNTICQSTAKRQAEAKTLAQTSDLMVVVGSRKSANTTHLAEILKDITKTIHIENDSELNGLENIIQNANEIGITAGASTPENIINKVVSKIQSGKGEK
ncbi:MAG: 4-hydroxy-3-methylbut-2-enyl diphosphate reductase [Cyanobacteria bacterium SIG31]|nr:4-hydroxy-3-methylbut-2-enyl diphosphate reductase [Cyanobacteria bacterium SIG31]